MEEQDEQLQMLQQFPLLIPNAKFDEYEGFVLLGNSEKYVHIKLPNAPSLNGLTLSHCSSWDVRVVLSEQKPEFNKLISSSSSMLGFLNWLRNTMKTSEDKKDRWTASFNKWNQLIEDLNKIGFDVLKEVDPKQLAWIKLGCTDVAKREHVLEVKFIDGVHLDTIIPEVSLQHVKKSTNIVQAYDEFTKQVAVLQAFWNAMESIDSRCWIIDPVEPTCADTKRQIALAPNVSVIVDIDPLKPLVKPEMKFLGPKKSLQDLQNKFSETLWPQEGSLYERLGTFLDITFPHQPLSQGLSQLSQDEMCCICLLAEELNETCDNCKSVFHRSCLKEWLQSISTVKFHFNQISGHCPVCKEAICCTV